MGSSDMRQSARIGKEILDPDLTPHEVFGKPIIRDTQIEQVEWRWHREDERHKSHLVMAGDTYRWDDGTLPYLPSCNMDAAYWVKEPNNDMTNPCLRCIRAAKGEKVGKP